MSNATITITDFNYENALRLLFPLILSSVNTLDSRNIAVQAVQQLGDAALPIATGILARIPDSTLNELIVDAVNAYSSVITGKANELLKSKLGDVAISSVSASQYNGLSLEIEDIHSADDYSYRMPLRKPDFALTDEQKQVLVAAVTGYLKDTVSPNNLRKY